MTVRIVTDSAAALPVDLVAKHDLAVVPMWLTVDGETFRDGDRPLGNVDEIGEVSTSGPAPGEFATAIGETAGDDGVLVLTLATQMSSTYEAAVLGASLAGVDAEVRVVDTGTAAGAEALVVLAAAETAGAGAPLAEVEATARRAMEQVRLVATVPTLDRLVASGRVPNIAGTAARRLGIAPLFEFRAGTAKPLRPALGHDGALDRIVSRWRRTVRADARLHVAALHADARADAETLLARVEEVVAPATSFLGEFGSVMVVHTGRGLVGLAWRWEPRST